MGYTMHGKQCSGVRQQGGGKYKRMLWRAYSSHENRSAPGCSRGPHGACSSLTRRAIVTHQPDELLMVVLPWVISLPASLSAVDMTSLGRLRGVVVEGRSKTLKSMWPWFEVQGTFSSSTTRLRVYCRAARWVSNDSFRTRRARRRPTRAFGVDRVLKMRSASGCKGFSAICIAGEVMYIS